MFRHPQYMKEMLRQMKGFVVLEDVNKFKHLKYLVRGHDWFGPKSGIIITTRDKVQNTCEVEEFYH